MGDFNSTSFVFVAGCLKARLHPCGLFFIFALQCKEHLGRQLSFRRHWDRLPPGHPRQPKQQGLHWLEGLYRLDKRRDGQNNAWWNWGSLWEWHGGWQIGMAKKMSKNCKKSQILEFLPFLLFLQFGGLQRFAIFCYSCNLVVYRDLPFFCHFKTLVVLVVKQCAILLPF